MKLNDRFSTELIEGLSKAIFPDFKVDVQRVEEHSSLYRNVVLLGSSRTLDTDVFVVELSVTTAARVQIAGEAFRILKRYASTRAIFAFWAPTQMVWRLSLVTADAKIVDGSIATEYSNPKRHSFVLGPGQKTLTARRQLLDRGACRSFEDLQDRFSLEVVNREFYQEITRLFYSLVGSESTERRRDRLVLSDADDLDNRRKFAVRLIGRLVFCWFLRQKRGSFGQPLLPDGALPTELDHVGDYYVEVLEPLFFEVLNTPLVSRSKRLNREIFDQVPYLNGGLFEPIRGDGGDYYGHEKSVRIPSSWFHDLFTLFSTYNFTIDENTTYDVDLSVDPEMLGRIFENLLAEINPETGESARKSSGSFYTPREIVNYMVDRSLSGYLVDATGIESPKIDALVSYDDLDDLAHPLTDEEQTKVIKALARFKALDPACGSGAFPIGILQKLVFVLRRVDPDCRLWIEEQIAPLPRELRKLVRNKLQRSEVDYVRKLGILKQCIHGVDIQPVATEISRLRCWLTLIVDENVDDLAENRGIAPLPNLDFKFVTANSLMTLQRGGTDIAYEIGSLFENPTHIEELESIREEYFDSDSESKESIKREFTRVQRNMKRSISLRKDATTSKYESLAHWRPFEHGVSDWFDAYWMFGVHSFDLIIGNPPYLGEKGHKEIFQHLKESRLGRFYSKNMDLFYFFFHHAIECTHDGGYIALITTNYYPTATFAEKLRSDLRARTTPIEFINFNETRIFDAAPGQHNLISIVRRGSSAARCRLVMSRVKGVASTATLRKIVDGNDAFADVRKISGSIFEGPKNYMYFERSSNNASSGVGDWLSEMRSLPVRLIDVCSVRQGLHANPDQLKQSHVEKFPKIREEVGSGIFVISEQEARRFSKPNHLRPFYKNSDVGRFVTKTSPTKYVIYLNKELVPNDEERSHLRRFKSILEQPRERREGKIPWYSLHWPREEEMFVGEKIVCPQRSALNTFGYNQVEWFASADVYFITARSPETSLRAILGLLNSDAYLYWLYHRGKRKGAMLELYQVPLSEIPLPSLGQLELQSLSDLVDRRLLSSDGDEAKEIEVELDRLVVDLLRVPQATRSAIQELGNSIRRRAKSDLRERPGDEAVMG